MARRWQKHQRQFLKLQSDTFGRFSAKFERFVTSLWLCLWFSSVLCISILRVASEPRVKFVDCKSALNPR